MAYQLCTQFDTVVRGKTSTRFPQVFCNKLAQYLTRVEPLVAVTCRPHYITLSAGTNGYRRRNDSRVTNRIKLSPTLTIYLSRVLCLSFVLSYSFLSSCHPVILSSCHICGTLSYSLCLRIQTDGVDETEGFEGEGLELEILKTEILKREGVNRLFFV